MIERHPFGRTGHASSRVIFGAVAVADLPRAEANRVLALVTAAGVNHIDTAASYGDSELKLAPWLAEHRAEVFLATKTGERTRQGAHDEIRRSLDRLGVDQVDLIQLHHLVDEEEWETGLGPGGALEAAIEAQSEGLVRFIGVTGHGLTVARQHRRALERFPFDSVLLPYNYVMLKDETYASEFEDLVAVCQERGVAVQTIKTVTRRSWPTEERSSRTWYEPLTEQADIDLAVHWVLGRPGIFLNTVGDHHILPKLLDAAASVGHRPSDDVMEELVERAGLTSLFGHTASSP